MASVNFLYRSVKEKSNLHLRLLYRNNENDYVFGANTKLEVEKDYWNENHVPDKKTKKIRGSKDVNLLNKRLETNTELNKIENFILNAFKNVSPAIINKEWLQIQVNEYYDPPKESNSCPNELVKYFDFYIDYRKNEMKETSRQKYNVIKHKLERFEKFRKKVILIKDVNDNFKKEFIDYCISQKYVQNTMQRELVGIKTVCKHARFLGVETHAQLDSLRLDRAKSENIYLNLDEIKAIENIDKTKLSDSLENAKDWLIISCFSGQRISDFMRFTKEMIRIQDGKKLLEFTQKKTNKIMTIPLLPKVVEILDKRNGEFPYAISDQKYNAYIKKVCAIAELTQIITGSKKVEVEIDSKNKGQRKQVNEFRKCDLVSSHIGRRSFATNYYGKIPTSLMINITGHTTEKMYLAYVGKSSKDLAMETFKYLNI